MQYQELASVFFLCCLPGCFLKVLLHKAVSYSRNRDGAAYSLEEKPLSHSVPAYFEKYPDICIRQLIGTKNHFSRTTSYTKSKNSVSCKRAAVSTNNFCVARSLLRKIG